MLDVLIKGGTVVTPHTAEVMDVGIVGERIVAVGQPGTLHAEAGREIDAQGKILLPGGIEPHAHIGIPVPPDWTGQPDVMTQPPEAASRAAAFGGVTTIIHLAHNNLSEDLAFRNVIRLAEHTGAGVYFVHTTAKEGVAAIADARRRGLPVYGEALHHYLHFTCEDYARPEGMAVHTYPALKFADDRDALIDGLLDGRLCTTATDEYTTYKGPKLFSDRIESICGGHNGVETRIPVAFTKCVVERGMPWPRFADVVATNAARILGLYPQKGVIQPGSDADLVLLDPGLTRTLGLDDLHADSDYSIWEGYTCRGYPTLTMLRGKVIVENGKLLGHSTDGRWLARHVAGDVTSRPAV